MYQAFSRARSEKAWLREASDARASAARQLLLLAAMMDVGGIYASRSPYPLPHTPISAEPSALPVSPDPATVSLSQKLDHIVTLMQSQSQERAAIRKELVSVKEEVALLQEKADSSQLSRSPLKKGLRS